MIRSSLSCLILSLSAGCAAWPHAPGLWQGGAVPAPSRVPGGAAARYHFDWQLSGHRAVAPLQVFDDGRRTWLQFPAGQPSPAIFARSGQGDTLLSPLGPHSGFLVLDGVWPHLVVRGGHLQSDLRRLAGASPGHAAAPAPVGDAALAPDAGPATQASSASVKTAPVQRAAAEPASPRVAVALPTSAASAAPALSLTGAGDSAGGARAAATVFQVGPKDGTVRAALSRWALAAGWTFTAEHWAVGVDIPITGSATFQLPFLQAVQELVGSTELSDHPLQPCFYANQVLRVVPYAQSCDRTAGGVAS